MIRQAIAHAQAVWPLESCGAFLREGGGVRYLRMSNVHPDPREGFEIDADEFRALSGVLGVVHSHPVLQRGPSHADMQSQLATAVPFYVVVLHHGNYADFFGWGDQLPVPPLLNRTFRPGVTDCYAALRHFHWLAYGQVIPDFPREYEWWEPGASGVRVENPLTKHVTESCFETVELEDLRPGDGLLMALRSEEVNHCAVYIGDGLIYHHLHGKISRRDPLVQWTRFVRQCVRFVDAGS